MKKTAGPPPAVDRGGHLCRHPPERLPIRVRLQRRAWWHGRPQELSRRVKAGDSGGPSVGQRRGRHWRLSTWRPIRALLPNQTAQPVAVVVAASAAIGGRPVWRGAHPEESMYPRQQGQHPLQLRGVEQPRLGPPVSGRKVCQQQPPPAVIQRQRRSRSGHSSSGCGRGRSGGGGRRCAPPLAPRTSPSPSGRGDVVRPGKPHPPTSFEHVWGCRREESRFYGIRTHVSGKLERRRRRLEADVGQVGHNHAFIKHACGHRLRVHTLRRSQHQPHRVAHQVTHGRGLRSCIRGYSPRSARNGGRQPRRGEGFPVQITGHVGGVRAAAATAARGRRCRQYHHPHMVQCNSGSATPAARIAFASAAWPPSRPAAAAYAGPVASSPYR